MRPTDQAEVVAFLTAPASYRRDGPVETMATHISEIFLVGDRAFKLKRAVTLPYADFSTAELRLAACEKEVALNSLTAPEIYLGVRRITREANGPLAFDGRGPLVDAVVEMKRFDQAALLDRMAVAGALTPELMTATARAIARFHGEAPVVHDGKGAANIAAVLDVNRAGFATSGVFSGEDIARLDAAFRGALARHATALDRREMAGMVRRCHGDLHLRNICVIDGAPRLFDCLEFNDGLATVDVLYDLAFLLMDLWHRDLPALANLVANRYLDETGDEEGFVLLPFFMAVRAEVRAHVTATAAEGEGRAEELAREARSYFALAADLLRDRRGRLVAIGGLSGSGKTTVAEALAPRIGAPPGARVLESDRVRKAFFGVSAETRLPPEAYRPEVSERVYAELARRAGLIASEGGTAVVSAVLDRAVDRERIAKEAESRGVPFLGIWLDASPALLRERVACRAPGASDATLDVLAGQLAREHDPVEWPNLDASRSPEELVAAILAM